MEEFCEAAGKTCFNIKEDQVDENFNEADLDRNGKINVVELEKVFRSDQFGCIISEVN